MQPELQVPHRAIQCRVNSQPILNRLLYRVLEFCVEFTAILVIVVPVVRRGPAHTVAEVPATHIAAELAIQAVALPMGEGRAKFILDR
jgi:hypothetical protein